MYLSIFLLLLFQEDGKSGPCSSWLKVDVSATVSGNVFFFNFQLFTANIYKHNGVLWVDSYFAILLNSLISCNNIFVGRFFRAFCFLYRPLCCLWIKIVLLLPLFIFLALSIISNIIIDRNDESGYPCLILDLKDKAFSMMSCAVSFLRSSLSGWACNCSFLCFLLWMGDKIC